MLQSGVSVEDRRLRDRDSIARCLAFDAAVTWRLFALDRYARDAPTTPAEIDRIWAINRVHLLPAAEHFAALLRDVLGMVLTLARVAGWHPTKWRPLPGNDLLRRASQRIQPTIDFW